MTSNPSSVSLCQSGRLMHEFLSQLGAVYLHNAEARGKYAVNRVLKVFSFWILYKVTLRIVC